MRKNLILLIIISLIAVCGLSLVGCNSKEGAEACFDAVNNLESYQITSVVDTDGGLQATTVVKFVKNGDNYTVTRKTSVPNEIGATEKYTTTEESETWAVKNVKKFSLNYVELKDAIETVEMTYKFALSVQQAKDMLFIDNCSDAGVSVTLTVTGDGAFSSLEAAYATSGGNTAKTTVVKL